MRKRNPWRDTNGNYLPSKCSTRFLDKLELMFSCKIDREYKLQYGKSPTQVRYYDGKYKDVLIELDGSRFHSSRKSKKNDHFKTQLAEQNQYKILRLPLNSIEEIDIVLAENLDLLKSIFGADEKECTANIIDKIMSDV